MGNTLVELLRSVFDTNISKSTICFCLFGERQAFVKSEGLSLVVYDMHGKKKKEKVKS